MVAFNRLTQSACTRSKNLICEAQKGFKMGVNGCAEHCFVLNELMKHVQRNRRSLYLVSVDFNGAFDSIPHQMIIDTMNQVGFHGVMTSVIDYMYSKTDTRFRIQGSYTDGVRLNRGVRQGCPFSPALFCLALEPLLRELERMKEYGYHFENDEGEITDSYVVQAFADDIILISEAEEGMRKLLQTVEDFCTFSSMQIAPGKCRAFTYVMLNGRRVTIERPFMIDNQEIKTVDMIESMKYLGIPIG